MIAIRGPHTTAVNPIVAAAADADRRELAKLSESARFDLLAIAADPTALAALLRKSRDAWVLTGGKMRLTLPFLSSARAADAPAVAVLSDPLDLSDRSDLRYGGLALLRGSPDIERLQAAVAAIQAGLSVRDSDVYVAEKSARSSNAPLSARERTVLELAGAGLSNKAVGRQLGISPNTVKFHLQSTFAKLGVSSRTEAVLAAIRRGDLSV